MSLPGPTPPAVASASPRPLSVLIVDDEPLARQRLKTLVEANAVPACRVVGESGSVEAAVRQLVATPCDLVLLDIVMPGGSGLKLADDIRRLPGAALVVFVSAHSAHALRAFEVDAVDYLTKPVRRERLQAALLRAAQRLAQAPAAAQAGPVIVVSDRGRVLRVPVAEVLYLKAELKYVTLCSLRGTWLLDEALADLEPRLGQGFLRVHRNAVVALAAVRALARRDGDVVESGPQADGMRRPPPEGGESSGQATLTHEGWQLQMSNGDWLAVSRRQLQAVREVLARDAD